MHWPSPPSNNGRYGKPDASVIGSTHANHRSAHSPRPTPEGPARDNPIAGPRTGTTQSEPSAPASAGASGRHNELFPGPPQRAPRSQPIKPGAQALGLGEGTTVSGAPRATGPDEGRRNNAGPRGMPERHAASHNQGTRTAASRNGHGVPQTQRVRTTRNEPRQEDRSQATPAAVQTDVCAPSSKPSPCRLRNSRHPDGRVCAQRVPSPCRLLTAAIRTDECAPRRYPTPAGYE